MTDDYKINDTVRIFLNDENSYFVGTVKKFEDGVVTLFIAIDTDDMTYTFDDDESVELKFDEYTERYYWSAHISKLKEIEDCTKYL